LQEAFGIRDESVFKAASGLHGGMGKGDVCGSLLGSSLIIGLICGKSIEESGSQKPPPVSHGGHPEPDNSTRLVGELYDWFGQEFGSVKCNDIRGKHEQEVNSVPGANKLAPGEKTERMRGKCDDLCGKTAARTVTLLWPFK
jgi:hypothetical protein